MKVSNTSKENVDADCILSGGISLRGQARIEFPTAFECFDASLFARLLLRHAGLWQDTKM